MESEEFSMEIEESSMESKEELLDDRTIGFLVFLGFLLLLGCYMDPPWGNLCKNKPDQENLETTERQDQVIKTYQKAKLIISGTALESLQLTISQLDRSTYTGYKIILGGDTDE